ncbi:MAG TPA: STAS domain-containing protein [Methanoregulaceae archaeon]|nr:STAS domain-containing protein [Methanoregulaceae archaeon]
MTEFELTAAGGVAVLSVSGRADTATAPALEEALDGVIAGGGRRVLIDLARVPYISSGGLRVLLATAKRLRGDGDRYALCSLAPEVEKVMRLTGFSSILSIYPDRESALAVMSA